MKNNPTEKEFKTVVKDILLKRLDKPLEPCTKYPKAKHLRQKVKLERKL